MERASEGAFASEPEGVFARWRELTEWARDVDVAGHPDSIAYGPFELGAPSPRPQQVFGIGLNYADHAEESGLAIPEHPVVFTKFASSVTGPDADVRLPGDTVDWEAELVVVIGAPGRRIAAGDALDHVAGFTVGQDLSERTVQWQGSPAQFSVGKSFEAFAPTGPVIVTLDEFDDPDSLAITTDITAADGTRTRVQQSRTDQLIFSVSDLVSRLSEVVELRPGDLIFTGTPSGVGAGMAPPRFLQAGDTVTTEIEGIGTITQRFHR
ncbi:fumarylacetoacetate hydrolase family protein [Leifsonia poae]|uniref:fumarylacetoacetate hydrolase family protein n=1 Tax=Leifsonia poae TaxID=110933 RepID=UPI001CBADA2D|nr:fumarylacetoacetate hydrolase family protein [Leifsonia poae]